ncbi:MAG: hypothetical protein KC516_01800 [Nanoarchaeota archaeon]|nr:hypothetical protein [Nanoarchaeota archaeon]
MHILGINFYKKALCLIFFIILINLVSANYLQQSYHIQIDYYEGNVSIQKIELVEGFSDKVSSNEGESYSLKIISFDGEVYRDYPFNFPREVFVTPGPECFVEEGIVDTDLCGGPTHYLSNFSSVLLKIPFSPGAKSLELVDPSGRLILKEDLSKFSCGDLICEEHETYSSCRKDCSLKDNEYFEIGIALGIIILLGTGIGIYLKKKK